MSRLDQTMSVTDWDTIKLRAGRDERLFPNRRVYLFGSLHRLDPTDEWLARFRREATEHGLDITSKNGHLYVLLPVGS